MSDEKETPLINAIEGADGEQANEPTNERLQNIKKALIKVFEQTLGWSPFIVVQVMGSGLYALTTAFLLGTIAAAFVILYSFLQEQSSIRDYKPKTLDVGQFALFAILYIVALIASHAETGYPTQLLFLWFNPLTTGGIALIMYVSVVQERPFVLDYVRSEMPPAIFEKLTSRKWLLQKLNELTMDWVGTFISMTLIVVVQPALVTIFYEGNPANDTSGFMTLLGNVLSLCQLVILFSMMNYFSSQMSSPGGEEITKRVKHVKMNGLTQEESRLYGDAINIQDSTLLDNKNHRIQSLTNVEQLNLAGEVLADAFEDDEMLAVGYDMDTKEEKLNFFQSNIKSIAVFNHVFGCFNNFENSSDTMTPQCVMACIPVYSKSHEEMEVFNTFQAWLEHGYSIPADKGFDLFPLPTDEFVEVGEMKKKKEHGLLNTPFLYIAFFGSASSSRGQGYGKTLLKYVIGLSEKKQVPLVLVTATVKNRAGYEKFGFRVVDHVKTKPNWVLMIRSAGQNGYGAV